MIIPLLIGAALCVLLAQPGAAQGNLERDGLQSAATLDTASTINIALASNYQVGAFHRFLLGQGYRDLWATPVQVEVLHLETFAGGLRPTRSGNQTHSLRFIGGNGHEYVLRSADKVAGYAVAPELRGTVVESIIQDQVSASHPFSVAVADRLEAAIGLPPLHPKLVILPDDSMLGKFRADFAGMVGYIQERPEEGPDRAPGFAGYNRVIGTDALIRRRRERPEERVDVPRYLAARVLDLLLGDWDRHRDQWRWGRVDSVSAWQPIPRDHDWAFGRYDGLVLSYLRHGPLPHLVRFNRGRLPIEGLTWFGRDLDRELLPRLEYSTWDSVVTAVRSELSDSVIASAVSHLPPGVPQEHRSWLDAILRDRRDHLPAAAFSFYLTLARDADLHTTDADERISIEGTNDGDVLVDITGQGAGSRLARRFYPSETKEVRIYAHRGADTVFTHGSRGRIRVRVIGGGGKDAVVPDGGPKIDFYQGGEAWRPLPKEGDPPPPRDWGSRTSTLPHVSASTETGIVFGVNLSHINYGFRRDPIAGRMTVRALFGTATTRPGLQFSSLLLSGKQSVRFVLDAMATGIEVLRFYQLGNGSLEDDDRRFHRVRAWQVSITPAVELIPYPGVVFGVGPKMRYLDSKFEPGRLLETVRPYGSPSFGEIGLRGYARWDARDVAANPRRGFLVEVGGDVVPALWDAEDSFSSAYATASTYITPGGGSNPTLALRAGGRHVWGLFPYFESARIGGEGTLRGYSDGRFLGDAALFGSAELRVPVARAKLIVPGRIGLLGFADAGRVFLDGESSKDWHEAFGGGLWFSFLGPGNVASFTVAKSPERTIVNLGGGMAF